MVKVRSGKKIRYDASNYGRLARQKKKDIAKAAAVQESGQSMTRATSQRLGELQAAITSDTPDTPPSILASTLPKTLLRGAIVPCHHYGPLRATQYPDYFFCGQCDKLEAEYALNPKRINPISSRYGCKAKHKCWAFPTDRKETASTSDKTETKTARRKINYSVETVEEESEDEEEELPADGSSSPAEEGTNTAVDVDAEEDSESPIGSLLSSLRDMIKESDYEIMALRQEIAGLQHKMSGMVEPRRSETVLPSHPSSRKEHTGTTSSVPETPDVAAPKEKVSAKVRNVEKVRDAIDHAIGSTRLRNDDSIVQAIVDAIWSDDYREGAVKAAILKRARNFIRKHIYPPWKVLMKCDEKGSLNFENIEAMRSIETENLWYFRGSILPCTADLKRTAEILERAAKDILPLTSSTTASGAEMVSIEPKAAFLHLLSSYELEEVAKERPLEVAFAIDAANLTKYLSHTTAGLKMTDRACRNFKTKVPLLSDDLGDSLKAQSSTLCYPIRMIAEGETHESVKEFKSDFDFLHKLTEDGCQEIIEDIKPIRLTTEGDMSLAWKALGRGGAMKVCTFPCHCCPIKSENIIRANPSRCHKWCMTRSHVETPTAAATTAAAVPADDAAQEEAAALPQCYHHDLIDDERLGEIALQMTNLERTLKEELATINASTRIDRDSNLVEPGHEGETRNPLSIHFQPNSRPERHMYSSFLNKELSLRKLSTSGDGSQRRERLRDALKDEARLKRLIETTFHMTPKEGALFQLLRCVPCLLHLENRVGLKLVYMLLVEGLSNTKEARLFEEVAAEGPRIDMFLGVVQSIVNTTLIGTKTMPGQWKCPYSKEQKEVGIVKFNNTKTRKFVAGLESLIEVCVDDEERAKQWRVAVSNYRDAIIIARKKSDYSDEDITAFQAHIDRFFVQWVDLHGKEGVTNYIHMLGSGHVAEYMFRYRNLYRHSQQGWEQMNDVIKRFFFNRTARGGATNKGKGLRKRLLPIGRWFQRRLMWLKFDGDDIERFKAQQKQEDKDAAAAAAAALEDNEQEATRDDIDGSSSGSSSDESSSDDDENDDDENDDENDKDFYNEMTILDRRLRDHCDLY